MGHVFTGRTLARRSLRPRLGHDPRGERQPGQVGQRAQPSCPRSRRAGRCSWSTAAAARSSGAPPTARSPRRARPSASRSTWSWSAYRPAELVPAVTDALAAGARSLVVITAGLSELGAEGLLVEREVVRLVREAGAVLVGPNCLGVVDTGTALQLAHDVLPTGSVAVLSQSGNVALDLAALLEERGLGVSRFVSVGNQADLTVVDLLAGCLDHHATRAVAIYVEDLVDGRAFMSAARRLVEAGKPVVLLAPGRSAAAVRSAVSHTGSLTSGYRVVDAACAAAGVHRVDNPTQLADLLQGLLADRRMPGRRAVVLTDGGGHGAIACDALAAAGLETPVLADTTRDMLRARLPRSPVSNPVDLAGAGRAGPDDLPRHDRRTARDRRGRRRAAHRVLRRLLGAGLRARASRGRCRAGARRRGDRSVQAGGRAHDPPRRRDRTPAARRRDPGAPRRRPRCRGAGRSRASRRSPGRSGPAVAVDTADRGVVRRREAGVRRGRHRLPRRQHGARRGRARCRVDGRQGSRWCSRLSGDSTSPTAAAWCSACATPSRGPRGVRAAGRGSGPAGLLRRGDGRDVRAVSR